ncbi:ferritin family protein [Chloroflexota bacterium]
MVTEQDKTLEALKISIQMEIDGKEYYLKAGRESGNELGSKLLQSLTAEEDLHRKKFEQIYEVIRTQKIWPATDFKPDGGKGLRTIFSRAIKSSASDVKVSSTELDAVAKALDMESKSFDFYTSQAQKATFDAERDFYQTLAFEEKEHQLILLDYQEYLKDPAAYFVEKEHPSLDGG